MFVSNVSYTHYLCSVSQGSCASWFFIYYTLAASLLLFHRCPVISQYSGVIRCTHSGSFPHSHAFALWNLTHADCGICRIFNHVRNSKSKL